MSSMEGFSLEELVERAACGVSMTPNERDRAAAELTRRLILATQALTSESRESAGKLVRLTRWLIAFTVVLVALTGVTLAVLVRG